MGFFEEDQWEYTKEELAEVNKHKQNPKVLKASWTIESIEDWNRVHGMDIKPKNWLKLIKWYFDKYILRKKSIEDILADQLALEIRNEIDKEILSTLVTLTKQDIENINKEKKAINDLYNDRV